MSTEILHVNWNEWGYCHRCGVSRGAACLDLRYNQDGPYKFYRKRPHALRHPYLFGRAK